MRVVEPEKEVVCTSCGACLMYTKNDILYSWVEDDWRYRTTWEIHGYVYCPKCHKSQYIGILVGNTHLNEEQFNEKYKGHIYKEKKEPGDNKIIHCYNCGKEIKHGDTINVVPYDERVFCSVYCLADSYGGIEVDSSMDDYNTYYNLGKKDEKQ